MRHVETMSALGQAIGMSVALVAVLASPPIVPAAASIGSAASSASGLSAAAVDPAVEAPSDTALRTTGTLAGVALGMAGLVGLWWYLVIRGRRD